MAQKGSNIMNCPYCNKELEAGVIQSQHELRWQKVRHIFISHSDTTVMLSDRNIWRGSAVKAMLCRECQKIIIDYADEYCDMNKKHNDNEDTVAAEE